MTDNLSRLPLLERYLTFYIPSGQPGGLFVCRRIDRIEIIDIKNNKYYGRGKR